MSLFSGQVIEKKVKVHWSKKFIRTESYGGKIYLNLLIHT